MALAPAPANSPREAQVQPQSNARRNEHRVLSTTVASHLIILHIWPLIHNLVFICSPACRCYLLANALDPAIAPALHRMSVGQQELAELPALIMTPQYAAMVWLYSSSWPDLSSDFLLAGLQRAQRSPFFWRLSRPKQKKMCAKLDRSGLVLKSSKADKKQPNSSDIGYWVYQILSQWRSDVTGVFLHSSQPTRCTPLRRNAQRGHQGAGVRISRWL